MLSLPMVISSTGGCRRGLKKTEEDIRRIAADATHVYAGIDLSRLSGALKPSVVITATDLARIGTRVAEFYAGDLLCPVGKTPLYLGQPVAMLIFEEFDTFDQARLALRDEPVLKFDKETGPVTMPNYGAFRFTRVAGPTPDAPDVYSPVKNGWVSPGVSRTRGARYGRDSRSQPAQPMPKPRPMAKRSERNLQRTIRHFWCWTGNSRRSQSTRWLSSRKAALPGMTTGARISSSCQRAVALRGRDALAYLLGNAQASFKPARINTQFRLYAAADSADAIIRRFRCTSRWRRCSSRIVRSGSRTTAIEQFQSGIKRHAFKIRSRIGVDRASGKMVAFAADQCWMAAASPIFRAKLRASAPTRRSASMTSRKST